MTTIDEKKERLAELIARRDELTKAMDNFEVDPDEYENSYCEAIDEDGPVRIGTLEYTASYVLREIDPTAYRCGLNDYVDGIDKEDDAGFKELQEQLDENEDEISDIETEIEEEENEDEEEAKQ